MHEIVLASGNRSKMFIKQGRHLKLVHVSSAWIREGLPHAGNFRQETFRQIYVCSTCISQNPRLIVFRADMTT